MSFAVSAIHEWERRTRRPGPQHNDPWYQYQKDALRDLLIRLEAVLEDEEVPEETARRVIRCMLYGSPHASDAVLRVHQQEQIAQVLQNRPTSVLVRDPSSLPEDVKDWLGVAPE